MSLAVRLGLFTLTCGAAYLAACSQSSEKPAEATDPKLPSRLGSKEDYLTTPCGNDSFPTDLRTVLTGGKSQAVGVCANFSGSGKQGIFSWNPFKKEEVASLSTPSELPDQIVLTSQGELVVDFAGAPFFSIPSNLKIHQMGNPNNVLSINFPPIPLAQLQIPTSAKGKALSGNLVLNMPKGIETDSVGNKYVALSDLIFEGGKADYPPGVVFIVNPQGQVDGFLQMVANGKQYYNPVGLLIQGDRLMVKLAGALDDKGRSLSPSALLTFDLKTKQLIQAIDLGSQALGLDGKIALTKDGSKAVLSTADNSGNLLIVDLKNGRLEQTIPVHNSAGKPIKENGRKIFFSNVQVRGENAYVANINSRTLYHVNLKTGKTEEELDLSSAPLSLPEEEYAETVSELLLEGGRLFVGRGAKIVAVTLQ